MLDLRRFVRDIPDYPQPGILFRDITPMLADPKALAAATEAMAEPFLDAKIDIVAAAEARGFISARDSARCRFCPHSQTRQVAVQHALVCV